MLDALPRLSLTLTISKLSCIIPIIYLSQLKTERLSDFHKVHSKLRLDLDLSGTKANFLPSQSNLPVHTHKHGYLPADNFDSSESGMLY